MALAVSVSITLYSLQQLAYASHTWQSIRHQGKFDPGMCIAQVNAEEPANKDKVVMEWSNNQLLRLEESLAAMEKQIGSTHPHVSALTPRYALPSV